MNIRCNWCMSIFDEKYIKNEGDDEYCPLCKQSGYLLDNPVDVETIKTLKEFAKRLLVIYNESTLGEILDINIGITTLIDKLNNQQ